MKRPIPDWLVQIVWFGAGVFATGAFWYFLSRDDVLSATLSGAAALVFAVVAVTLQRVNDRSARFRKAREEIGKLLKEGQSLYSRRTDHPLPIEELNDWVNRAEHFFLDSFDSSYVVRLSNFSAMIFYGDGSEKSQYSNAIDGRLRRLGEFLKETIE